MSIRVKGVEIGQRKSHTFGVKKNEYNLPIHMLSMLRHGNTNLDDTYICNVPTGVQECRYKYGIDIDRYDNMSEALRYIVSVYKYRYLYGSSTLMMDT